MTIGLSLKKRWAEEAAQEAAEQARAQQEAREAAAQAEADRQRLELIAARDNRLEREAFQKLNDAERHELNRQTPDLSTLAQEARAKAESDYAEQIDREYEQELIEARNAGMASGNWHQGHKHAALMKAQENRKTKAEAYLKAREDRELKSEVHGDELSRILASLDDREQVYLRDIAKSLPSRMDRIQQARQAVAKEKQEELRTQYEAEIKPARGSVAWVTNIRAKYRALGLDI